MRYRSAEARYLEEHARTIELLEEFWARPVEIEEVRGGAYRVGPDGTADLHGAVIQDMHWSYNAGLLAPMPEDLSHLAVRLITLACYGNLLRGAAGILGRYPVGVYHAVSSWDTGWQRILWCDLLDIYSLIFLGRSEGRDYPDPQSIPDGLPRYGCGRLLLEFAGRIMARRSGGEPDYDGEDGEIARDFASKIERLDAAFGARKYQIDVELLALLRLLLFVWV